MVGFDELKRDIIEGGLCTGCGLCAGVCPLQSIEMYYETPTADVIPRLTGKCDNCELCYKVCPGKDIPMRDIDSKVFGRPCSLDSEPLGIFQNSYRGYATDDFLRTGASSGGVVSALIAYALDEEIIDGALLVGWNKQWPWRASPIIIESSSEIGKSARTVLEMVPVNTLLYQAVEKRGLNKIGVVGVPCHIHGLRKLQLLERPAKLAKSIRFMIGLFCASTYYYEGIYHLLREYGGITNLKDIVAMDYRGGQGANMVMTTDGRIRYIASKHDRTWHFLGPASYKRDRCLMCIDWSSELADISAADIFQKVESPVEKLTGIIVRTEIGKELIQGAVDKGYMTRTEHNPNLFLSSGLGWESKKHAGMFRLMQRKRFNWPTPNYQYPLKVRHFSRKKLAFI